VCWSKIKTYLRKRKYERELEELPEKIAQDIQKRQAGQAGIPVITSRSGPNMPKFLSCPQCYADSERVAKTGGGAYYKCRSHGEFFVRRTRKQGRRIPVHQHSK